MDRTFVVFECDGITRDESSNDTPVTFGSSGVSATQLERIVNRALESLCVDRIAVVCSGSSTERPQLPAHVPFFTSNEPDALSRLLSAAHSLSARAVIRISATAQDIDPARIDRLIVAAQEIVDCDYIGYADHDGNFVSGREPTFPDWCRVSALNRSGREAYCSADRASPARYLQSHPARFRLAYLSLNGNESGSIGSFGHPHALEVSASTTTYQGVMSRGRDDRRTPAGLQSQSAGSELR